MVPPCWACRVTGEPDPLKPPRGITRVTPDEARDCWDAMVRNGNKVSCRKVSEAFNLLGRPVSHAVIAKWRRLGWKSKDPTDAIKKAKQRIREAVKAINIDPATRLRELVAEAQLDLMQLKADSDADMLHKNAREALTTSIMAQRFIQRIAPDVAAADPTGLARLMEATVLFMRHIPPMFEQMISIKERSMKLEMPGIKEVQPATMEHDPLEAALARFRKGPPTLPQ